MNSQCRFGYGLNQNALEFLEFRSEVHSFSPYAAYESKIKRGMYFFLLLICKDLDKILTFQFAFSVEITRDAIKHEIPFDAWRAPEMMDDIKSQRNIHKATEERDS